MPINRLNRSDVVDFRFKCETTINMLDMYQQIATKNAVYPGKGTPLGLIYVALKGAGEAGEFAEHVGKAMRDDSLLPVHYNDQIDYLDLSQGELTPERKELLIKEAGDELWYLAAKCNELGISLSDVALANLEKLLDRAERNALQGSGDTR